LVYRRWSSFWLKKIPAQKLISAARDHGGLSPADDAVMCAGIAMASKTAPDGAHATANAHDSAGILLHGASVLGWHCQRHAAFGKPLWQG
jgi:hypothetical protein